MQAGGFRVDFGAIPPPILGLFIDANATLRSAWTLPERTREIVRLYSAFEHQCHT